MSEDQARDWEDVGGSLGIPGSQSDRISQKPHFDINSEPIYTVSVPSTAKKNCVICFNARL